MNGLVELLMPSQICKHYEDIQKKWNANNHASFLDEEENSLEKQTEFLKQEIWQFWLVVR